MISHLDCDTIPFLWQLADRFVLFDNFHQTETGPSTPNAIAMIGGQSGDTQWVLHPSEADPTGLTLPNLTDSPPFAGSATDTASIKPPYGPDESVNGNATAPDTVYQPEPGQINLTFAILPLSFMGSQIGAITATDQHLPDDLADVTADIMKIATHAPVNWGWYQQGYGPEPFDGQPTAMEGLVDDQGTPEHASYIVHHNGPQYFGYLGDNPQVLAHLNGLQQFFTDVNSARLPPRVACSTCAAATTTTTTA